MSRLVEGSILTILFFLVINVVFLNMFFIAQRSSQPIAASSNSAEIPSALVCDEQCQEGISNKVIRQLPSEFPMQQNEAEVEVREFIIPLGTGGTAAKEYESVPGVEVFIDTSLYPNIKQVVFETYMSIPTANGVAFAKLFNATDKHDVWYSEQSMETDKVTFREKTIRLDPGKKLYKVMMKSTMGYEAKLINARIRIITE